MKNIHKNQDLIAYYKQSDWLYKFFWHGNKSLGLHFGIDEPKTRTLQEAIINQYKIICNEGNIKSGMRVLDAGCGVGGASLYIAKKTGAKVYGISLVPEQISTAKSHAKDQKLDGNTQFEVMNYVKTDYPDDYFDLIFGIESVCHCSPKELFLKEAFRILKKGGQLIVSDGYQKRNPKNFEEKAIVKNFCQGWKLGEIILCEKFSKKIAQTGFKLDKIIDKTNSLSLTISRFKLLSFIGNFFQFLPGVRDNVLAIKSVLSGLETGQFGYFIHVARKT